MCNIIFDGGDQCSLGMAFPLTNGRRKIQRGAVEIQKEEMREKKKEILGRYFGAFTYTNGMQFKFMRPLCKTQSPCLRPMECSNLLFYSFVINGVRDHR